MRRPPSRPEPEPIDYVPEPDEEPNKPRLLGRFGKKKAHFNKGVAYQGKAWEPPMPRPEPP